MDKINIIIDGKLSIGNTSDYILDVAKRENIDIPNLCSDDRLKPFSSCFLCVVEIEGYPKLQPACSTKIQEGMNITTKSEKVFKARQTALNLLLSNHYADCVAPCKKSCPAGVDVQGYISLIEKGLFIEAVELIKQVNPLPAICGRVCVRPCEIACRRNLLDEKYGVGIDYLKRYVADIDLFSENKFIPKIEEQKNKKIAIIGAGPAGLSAAYFLQIKGYQCDIFEAKNKAGGWLRYGIPEYRLPNDILDKEIENITDLGVNIFYDKEFGKNINYKDIKENYDATILTIGSQKSSPMYLENENADGVLGGIDFLRNMEITNQKYDLSNKKVIVVGGGNTAMDCCRTAIRCGSKDVKVVYRRTEKEMPANPIEIHESKIEGVNYLFLHNPVKINTTKEGKVKSVSLIKMKLGKADDSGRRRPIPIENSEFEIETDFILSAIGQKTEVNFIENINSECSSGKLLLNKWGNIDSNPQTLQTGVPEIFIAGDSVSGPATIIDAIAHAKIASLSCHQYLSNKKIEPEQKEFVSSKDNFKVQTKIDYLNKYANQERQEMPVLNPSERNNFKEVELGYPNIDVALKETNRCLECGCSEFYECKLQKYATEYKVNQKKYSGNFKEYNIDFSHNFIELDSNKCILCAKCVRFCSEIVGANALGLINRGFNTYIAPAMGKSLNDTNCESCGMCISICPTGAITENVKHKILPVKQQHFTTIDPFSSEGASVKIYHKANYIYKTDGVKSFTNKAGNISRLAKFSYPIFNDKERIKKPLLKQNNKWIEISFDKAFEIIKEKIKPNNPKTAIFTAGNLSNEELFLVQKYAKNILNINTLQSFNYIDRDYSNIPNLNLDFDEIKKAKKIYLFAPNLNYDNSLINHLVFSAKSHNNAKIILITDKDNSKIEYKCDEIIKVKNYYQFIKQIINYVIDNKQYNEFYLTSNDIEFRKYIKSIKSEKNPEKNTPFIDIFAKEFINETHAISIFQEKELSPNCIREIINLNILTGKINKQGSGVISVKELCNSQGLIDLQIRSNLCSSDLKNSKILNFVIIGEDPLGTAKYHDEIKQWFKNKEFMLVMDSFMTETAKTADLILPYTFSFETGGTYTNTLRNIQQFNKEIKSDIEQTNLEQLSNILEKYGISQSSKHYDILEEAIDFISQNKNEKLSLTNTEKDNFVKYFNYSCNTILKKAEKINKKIYTDERI